MDTIYHNPEHYAAFGGKKLLEKAVKPKYSSSQVSSYLQQNKVYRRYTKNRKKFTRAPLLVTSLGHVFQSDIFDLQKFSRQNSGYRYILLVVDCFSRFISVKPLKQKTAEVSADAINSIFGELQERGMLAPKALLGTDLGSEYWNTEADKVYEKYDIAHFALRKPHKAQLAEVSGKALLDRIYKYMYLTNSKRWIDKLDAFVMAKNNRPIKRLAGMPPSKINFDNQEQVYQSLIEHRPVVPNKATNPPLTIGQRVQLALDRLIWAKSYEGYFSDQMYAVKKRNEYDGIYRYTLVDLSDGAELSGTFYEQELLKVPDSEPPTTNTALE